MPIVLRAVVKPTSSLPIEQETVTRSHDPTTIRTKGRHDPCLLPRFPPMAEAMEYDGVVPESLVILVEA